MRDQEVHLDLDDEDLPGDEPPPDADLVPPDRRPLGDIPPDEGNVDAERKKADA